MKEKKKNLVKKVYRVLSAGIAFVSAMLLWYWNVSPYWGEGYNGWRVLLTIGLLFTIVYYFFAKMYQATKVGIYRLTELTYFHLLSFGIADALLYVEAVIWFRGFQNLNLISFAIIFAGQMVVAVGCTFVCNRLFAKYDEPKKIVVIYGKDDYINFLKKIEAKTLRYEVIGCFEDHMDMEIIKSTIDSCASVYLYEVNQEVRRKLVFYCDTIGTDIYLTQAVDELITMGFDISHTFDTPFIRTKREPVKAYYPFIKRTADILCSGLAICVLSSVFLAVAVAIKLYDGGSVFYKQTRLTKGHKEFQIYKFRSMIENAEKQGARLASQNDDRITPIGKLIRATRLDELPQLFNILKGDMSIIGPRPERPEIEKEYLEVLPEFGLRLQVKAGLSGYAQVFGKYNTTPLDKLKLDLLYINQRSVLLDIKIILYTIKIIFMKESTEGIEDGQMTSMNK